MGSLRRLEWVTGAACIAGLLGCGTTTPADEDGPMDGQGGTPPPVVDTSNPSPPGNGSMGGAAVPTAGAGSQPSPTVMAGAGALPVAGSGALPVAGSGATPTLPNTIPSARGGCNLDSGFPGDEACLVPPAPDKGFQVHVGPTDYADAAQVQQFLMEPGGESSECFFKKTVNDVDISYMVFEFSGRPGTHHIINTLLSEDLPEGFGTCRSFVGGMTNIGSLGGASKAHMPPMPIAPENENLGIPLSPRTQAQHDMHYFNLTEEPILREFWMNIYYVDPAVADERPNRIRGMGGLEWNFSPIAAGTHKVYPYECPIVGDGRIIQLLGHTHAHGVRESAWVRRAGGEQVKVFEQYDYLEPQIFMYDSLTENPMFSSASPGAWSGLLDVKDGDVLMWECEVNNDSAAALRYTNEVETGEMCNIWGMTVGSTISCP
jgi:hypothetical protein